ncbi:MAG TPA: MBL fold metallo-hydrolase [Caulobacteraceae bacterium]|jgi:flavorubredoxin
MSTRIDEIADGIFRISTWVGEVAPPAGFTFNQYLVKADEPLLFHCGPRGMFEPVSAAAGTVLPVASLRWISFGHVESDECGAMNRWLAAAPRAQVVQGQTACMVSLNDLADRPPRALNDGESLDLGGKRVRWIDTPHVPHAWESGLMFEETTGTLFCGDLFAQVGDGPAITPEDIVPLAIRTEDGFHASSLTATTAATIRGLKRFEAARLAVMHGSCFEGDCAGALDRLADYYAGAHAAAMAG